MRAYHRVDPLMDERKGHYSPSQLGAFLKVQLLAGRQTARGRFRSVTALRALLPSAYVRHLDFLLAEGDLDVMPDGTVYVDGWDEWQEGDLTVRDRMARLRNRHSKPTVTTTVTPPSPTATRSSVGVGVGISGSPSGGPSAREGPKDPLREAQRAAYIELYGNGNETTIVPDIRHPFTCGTCTWEGPTRDDYFTHCVTTRHDNFTAAASELEREANRLEALALHDRFKKGDLTEPEYERLRADIGKQPDDLTRAGA